MATPEEIQLWLKQNPQMAMMFGTPVASTPPTPSTPQTRVQRALQPKLVPTGIAPKTPLTGALQTKLRTFRTPQEAKAFETTQRVQAKPSEKAAQAMMFNMVPGSALFMPGLRPEERFGYTALDLATFGLPIGALGDVGKAAAEAERTAKALKVGKVAKVVKGLGENTTEFANAFEKSYARTFAGVPNVPSTHSISLRGIADELGMDFNSSTFKTRVEEMVNEGRFKFSPTSVAKNNLQVRMPGVLHEQSVGLVTKVEAPPQRGAIGKVKELPLSWQEMPSVTSGGKRTFFVTDTPQGKRWVVWSKIEQKWLVTGEQTRPKGESPIYGRFNSSVEGKKFVEGKRPQIETFVQPPNVLAREIPPFHATPITADPAVAKAIAEGAAQVPMIPPKTFEERLTGELTRAQTMTPPEQVAKTTQRVKVPTGWREQIGKTRTKEGRVAEGEIDWKNKVINYRDAESMANPEIANHEIAHVVIEELPDNVRLSLLDRYAKVKSPEWIQAGQDPTWVVKNGFHEEEIAMDYGQYLSDTSKLRPEVKTFIDMDLSKVVTPPTIPVKAVAKVAEEIPPIKPKEVPQVAKIAEEILAQLPSGRVPGHLGVGAIPPTGVIPTIPVVQPNGRLWLPEPPRNVPVYMQHARAEVRGSFRGKRGVLDTVEQAHQQVLKARDMGKNTVNYVDSYLQKAGNITKEFGLDSQGMATRVVNPQGRSLAINDVLSNPTHYTLTATQKEIAKRHGFVYQEALKLARSYGVEISELGSPDEFWQYIARKVQSRVDPMTGQLIEPPLATGGFKMGAKISAQKERVFDEMLQGLDMGYLYQHPDQVMAQHIQGIYRLIGNKQAENTVVGLMRQITEQAPLTFGERALAQPSMRARAANVEVANAIDKIFTPEQESRTLRIMADISGAMVGQVAALDESRPFIQGLTVLGHDLKEGLNGRYSNAWGKAYTAMWKATYNPETIINFRVANHDLYKRVIESGAMISPSEFVSGVSTTSQFLEKTKIGRTVVGAYKQTWGRLAQAYNDFGEMATVRMYESMEQPWLRNGGNIYDLGSVINRLNGQISSAARGVSKNRQHVERILAFAPNYLRASFLLLGDVIGRGAKAKEVQSTLATMLGIGFALYYGEEKLRGREPKIKPWPKTLGGDGAEAFTTEIAGQRVGLGSWMYGMMKTLAEVGALAVDDPGALIVWNVQHPVVRFAKSKLGSGVSLVSELATGRNFYGQPFDSPSDYLWRLAESVVPISGQSLIEKQSVETKGTLGGVMTQLGAQGMGLRTFPYSLKSQWTDEGAFTDYEQIPINEVDRKEMGLPYSRTEYREMNPDVDAKLFVSEQMGNVSSYDTIPQVVQLIADYKIDPSTISGITQRIKDKTKRQAYRSPNPINNTDLLIYQLRKAGQLPWSKDSNAAQFTNDLNKVDQWQQLTQDIVEDRSRKLITNVMRGQDPDLDVALIWGGYYETPQSDQAANLLTQRKQGETTLLGTSVSEVDVLALRKIIEPYYDIERYVWSTYPLIPKTLIDKIKTLENGTESQEAWAKQLLYQNPSMLQAREKIEVFKRVMRGENRTLNDYLVQYGD